MQGMGEAICFTCILGRCVAVGSRDERLSRFPVWGSVAVPRKFVKFEIQICKIQFMTADDWLCLGEGLPKKFLISFAQIP